MKAFPLSHTQPDSAVLIRKRTRLLHSTDLHEVAHLLLLLLLLLKDSPKQGAGYGPDDHERGDESIQKATEELR